MSKTVMLGVKVTPEMAERIDLAIYRMKAELGPGVSITRSDIVRQALELTVPTIVEPKITVRTRTPRAA
jgi:hypothetical protein